MVQSFCETWSLLDCHCPIDMDLYYFVRTTCSFTHFFWLPFFLKFLVVAVCSYGPFFSVFSHEVLMDKMFLSLCDCVPICNQWNVEKHVSVKHKIAWAAA